jgi:hypothetical protein
MGSAHAFALLSRLPTNDPACFVFYLSDVLEDEKKSNSGRFKGSSANRVSKFLYGKYKTELKPEEREYYLDRTLIRDIKDDKSFDRNTDLEIELMQSMRGELLKGHVLKVLLGQIFSEMRRVPGQDYVHIVYEYEINANPDRWFSGVMVIKETYDKKISEDEMEENIKLSGDSEDEKNLLRKRRMERSRFCGFRVRSMHRHRYTAFLLSLLKAAAFAGTKYEERAEEGVYPMKENEIKDALSDYIGQGRLKNDDFNRLRTLVMPTLEKMTMNSGLFDFWRDDREEAFDAYRSHGEAVRKIVTVRPTVDLKKLVANDFDRKQKKRAEKEGKTPWMETEKSADLKKVYPDDEFPPILPERREMLCSIEEDEDNIFEDDENDGEGEGEEIGDVIVGVKDVNNDVKVKNEGVISEWLKKADEKKDHVGTSSDVPSDGAILNRYVCRNDRNLITANVDIIMNSDGVDGVRIDIHKTEAFRDNTEMNLRAIRYMLEKLMDNGELERASN